MQALKFYFQAIAVAIWFFIACLITFLLLPFRWMDPNLGGLFARILAWGSLPILGFKIRVENEAQLYLHQPCIYTINHQSNLDILTMSRIYPYRTVVIGKKELKWIPIFGPLFAGTGNILIDRKDRKNSLRGLDVAQAAIKKNNLSVWIFPEGTRNHGAKQMLPFKKGAFHLAIAAQVPIVPVVSEHLSNYYDYKRRWILAGEIRIKVLAPIPTTGMAVKDVPELMGKVRLAMEQGLSEFSPSTRSTE